MQQSGRTYTSSVTVLHNIYTGYLHHWIHKNLYFFFRSPHNNNVVITDDNIIETDIIACAAD